MSIEETLTIKCDQCGTLKGETNHWFKILKLYSSTRGANYFELSSLTKADEHSNRNTLVKKVVCGERCMCQQISQMIGDL